MKPPSKILVVATRRIGDVLLATPLIRSLKHAWPDSEIDALVFEGTEGILEGNPDIHSVLTVPHRPGLPFHLRFLSRLWKRYDLALSAMPGDRPTLYAFVSGKKSIGVVLEGKGHLWKKKLLSEWTPFDQENHTVLAYLQLATLLDIEPCYEVVTAWRENDEKAAGKWIPPGDFAVLHVYPMYAYKMWKKESWIALAKWLKNQDMKIVLTGGKSEAEKAYINSLLPFLPDDTVDASGKLSLGGVACLLSRAKAYVGPDTAVTHMAAAAGIPTLALFGPSNPVKWGPWPKGFKKNPYKMKGSQHAGNVHLLQGKGDCVPCLEEGCERHVGSSSACLQNLPVIDAIEALKILLNK